MVDSCDKDLTDLIVSTLSDSVATHTRRHGVIKVVSCTDLFWHHLLGKSSINYIDSSRVGLLIVVFFEYQ